MRFSGKHVVVTGAASGLGLAIAKAVESEGASVTAIDRIASPFANSRICDITSPSFIVSGLLTMMPSAPRSLCSQMSVTL